MHHAERGRRFAYISTGDLTSWAKGTSHFQYPEPKNRRVTKPMPNTDDPSPVQSLSLVRHTETPVVMVGLSNAKAAPKDAHSSDGMDAVGFSSIAARTFATLGKTP